MIAPARVRVWVAVLFGVFAFGLGLRSALQMMGLSTLVMWVIPMARPDSFLIGMLLALAIERLQINEMLTRRRRLALLLGALLCIAVVAKFPDVSHDSWNRVWQYSAVSVSLGAIVLSLLAKQQSVLRRILSSKPLVYLGKISYGLYVYHIFGLWMVPGHVGKLFVRFQELADSM